MTIETELGTTLGLAATLAGIVRELPEDARARVGLFARQKVANAPMSLIAPSANAEQAKNLAQNAVGQVFKLLP